MLEGVPFVTTQRSARVPTIADVIARILAVNGVRRVFGLPGGEIAEIMAACRRLGLEFVLTRHENAACIMAGTDRRADAAAPASSWPPWDPAQPTW